MAKICLVLPANSFHAYRQSDRMKQFDDERGGLEVFRSYNVPATIFCQGVDLMMKPWLKEEMLKPGSIEFGCAPFSHTLPALFPDPWKTEAKYMCKGSVPVMFFPEFCVPDPNQMAGFPEFTLVLSNNSALYSTCAKDIVSQESDVVLKDAGENTTSISFGGKTGIMMREEWYEDFFEAFFSFQRFATLNHPAGNNSLIRLIKAVEKIAKMPDDLTVVIPLDLEAPYVGSFLGQRVWRQIFETLKQKNLLDVFQPLSRYLLDFKKNAVPSKRPHRKLGKWMSWEKQFNHARKLNNIRTGLHDERTKLVKAIATGSDWFAGWDRILEERRTGKVFELSAVNVNERPSMIPITYNPAVIDVQQKAFESLQDGETFASKLKELNNNDYFVNQALEMALSHNL